jgi:hypothetical protein
MSWPLSATILNVVSLIVMCVCSNKVEHWE